MGQLAEKTSSAKMAKSSSGVKKGKPSSLPNDSINFCEPKVQGILLVGLLAVLALALWFGFANGCLGGARRRQRRRSC